MAPRYSASAGTDLKMVHDSADSFPMLVLSSVVVGYMN